MKYSAFNIYPSYCKIAGLHLSLSYDVDSFSRQTYDLLNFVGDLGGLHDGLYAICSLIIGSFSVLNFNIKLYSSLFFE